MENKFLAPLIAGIIYISLLIFTIANRPAQKQQWLFAVYLFTALVWTSSDFLLRSEFFTEYKLLLFRVVIFASMWWAVQLYYFTRAFLGLPGSPGIWWGYPSLAIFGILIVLGYIPPSVTVTDGHVTPTYGWWFILYVLPLLTLAGHGIYSLMRRFLATTDLEEHNKIGYLVIAVGLLIVFGFAGITPLASGFPVSHLGGLLSASILTYAVVRHELVSFNLVLRRSLGLICLAALGFVACLLLFFLIHLLVGFELDTVTLVLATLATLAVSWFLHRLRPIFLGTIDQIFYRERYKHRQELLDFVRHGMGGVFSLQELSEGLLPPLVKALDCRGAHMLFQEAGGDFVAVFSEPQRKQNDPPLKIKQSSPIVEWLRREYLTKENIDILPEFRGLWEQERDKLKSLGIELLFPLVSRGNLIGILALCRKQSGKYSVEDSNLIESITSQAAISLEKEYLQEELRKREQELSLINKLALVITSSLNIQEVYEAFVTGLREVVSVDFATVALVEGRELCFSALSSQVGSAWKVGERIRLKGTATEWAIRYKKSLTEPDLEQDSIFITGNEFIKRGIRSIVYLPLITKDEGIGSLVIGSRLPNVYTPAHINLLERLAAQISTSVANSQLYARAEQRSRVDELTGLYNRRHFDETLKHEIDRHSRYGSMLSLALIDLDGFKTYNDTMGHLAGDKLLSQIGHLIQASIRNIDMAFRYGGDEFAIIMPHTSSENSYNVAERGRVTITTETAGKHTVTASFGLASWPSDGLTTDHLINAADRALYHAKRTGGNRTCLVSQMLPLATEIHEKTSASEKETLNIIYALASTIEARDTYTYGHSKKVRAYAVALAEALSLPPEKVALISHAALLHDIGKIGIYDEILNKSGKLDVSEFELIKVHPQLSRTIVAHVSSLTPCLQAILQHHERWDGKGYPDGLTGESISLEGRIMAIADSFDAMTSKRPYRAPMSSKEAVQEIKRCAGTQFDPSLVETFIPIALSTTPEELVIKQNPGKTEID